jgi:phosphatidylserine/phosphatidylglycerophosphate/cardiolipin synthase-like enzyme
VDVHILVPGTVNDVPTTMAGGPSSFAIGSTNSDNHSFWLNDEINLAVYDRGGRMPGSRSCSRRPGARSRPYTLGDRRNCPIKGVPDGIARLPFRSKPLQEKNLVTKCGRRVTIPVRTARHILLKC